VEISKLEDRQVARFERETAEQLDALAKAIRQKLAAGRRDDARLSAAMGRDLIRTVEAGMGRVERAAKRRFEEAVGALLQVAGRDLDENFGIDPSFSRTARASLQAQIGSAIDDLETVAEDRTGLLRRIILRAVRTNASTAALERELVERLDATVSQATTLVDTSLMSVDRKVYLTQAQESGFGLFLYAGPQDRITRDWCEPRVGKAFFADELDSEENDTGPQPASVYGGGWRCRHRWEPLTATEALRYPLWSPSRRPEVRRLAAQERADVREAA
jgi:hypothetical protein